MAERKKLAFLMLIYDEIESEILWNNYFRNIDTSKYTFFIHYKYDKPLSFFESSKIDNPVSTDYADLSLVKAQNLLLREALKDQENQKFIFLSNSCIPLKPFNHAYRYLLNNDFCFFNAAKSEHIFERNRGERLAEVFGRSNVKKASQWSVLTRPIATILSESDHILDTIFEPGKKDLADEYFYLSYLYFLQKQHQIQLYDYSAVESTTFEFWEDKVYPFSGNFTTTQPDNWDRRLKTYYDITENEIQFLVNSPCLFGRKFDGDCTVEGDQLLTRYLTEHLKL